MGLEKIMGARDFMFPTVLHECQSYVLSLLGWEYLKWKHQGNNFLVEMLDSLVSGALNLVGEGARALRPNTFGLEVRLC